MLIKNRLRDSFTGGPACLKLGAAGTGNLAGGPIRKEPQFLSNVGPEFLVLRTQLEASWATRENGNSFSKPFVTEPMEADARESSYHLQPNWDRLGRRSTRA